MGKCILYIERNVGVLSEVHKEGTLPGSPVKVTSRRQNVRFKTSFRNCVYKGMNGREWR